ncbi:MAG: DUF3365 domain-containing protein [Verrucomicrobiales bacterium]|nr:DUF3365 domain-containing protein [Verrucomicrobiales bacterium]
MKVKSHALLTTLLSVILLPVAGGILTGPVGGGEKATTAERDPEGFPRSIEEARGRARWVHEIIHGALQVMHRDFFDEDAVERSLPSQSLDDVFAEMARSHGVEIRWLGGNAGKGKDHVPKDGFEEKAVAALIAGAPEYEGVETGRYRFVGPIKMQNQCLKCHVRDRKSLEDRVGGLAISFPLALE